MNQTVIALRVAGTIFGLMSLAQLARLLLRPEIVVAGHTVPLWLSAIAFAALALLAFWLWRVSLRPDR
jgi:hypothetical protein